MKPSIVIYYDRKTNEVTKVAFHNNKDRFPLEKLQEMSEEWNANSENATFTKVITDPIVEVAFSWVKPQTSPFKKVSELIEDIEAARNGIQCYLNDLEEITDRLAETNDAEEEA